MKDLDTANIPLCSSIRIVSAVGRSLAPRSFYSVNVNNSPERLHGFDLELRVMYGGTNFFTAAMKLRTEWAQN